MKPVFFLFAATLLFGGAEALRADDPISPTNLDFESGEIGDQPPRWRIEAPARANYRVETTGWSPYRGSHCIQATLFGDGNEVSMTQTVDARPFRNRRIRFSAATRTLLLDDDLGTKIKLHASVSQDTGPDRKFGLGKPNLQSRDWTEIALLVDVPADAETLTFGFLVDGRGSAWIDAVQLTEIDEVPAPKESLSEDAIDRLVAFTRLLGLVRFFHPSDASAATDWDRFAIFGAREVDRTSTTLAKTLSVLFEPIAPTVQVFVDGKPPMHRDLMRLSENDPVTLVYWMHRGFGSGESGSVFSSQRVTPKPSDLTPPPPPNLPHIDSLPGNVRCLVPISLFRDSLGTRPHVAMRPIPEVMLSLHDRSARLGAVALAWSVLHHFYPYFDEVPADWDASLRQALKEASAPQDERQFLETLRRMISGLHDGQADVRSLSKSETAALPFALAWVEDQLVITGVASTGPNRLLPGDLILEIDGVSTEEYLTKAEELVSGATAQWKRLRAIDELSTGEPNQPITFLIRSVNGKSWSLAETRRIPVVDWYRLPIADRDPIAEIEPGLMVVDLARTTERSFAEAIPQIAKAHGILFDVRGYPRALTEVLAHLIDTPVTSPEFCVPVITRPDSAIAAPECSNWSVMPSKPRHTKNCVFLIDSRTVSVGETLVAIVKKHGIADLIGSPTAGTNGNINRFVIPGNIEISFTGILARRHDGSTHHGLGIQPTIRVDPTIRGIVIGIDETLETGLRILRERSGLGQRVGN